MTINPPFPVTYQVTETDAPPGFDVATIPVGNNPEGIAFNEDYGNMYVANFIDDIVSVIDGTTNTVVLTIPVGLFPRGIAFNEDNGFLYVTNFGSSTVSVIASLTTTFSDGCNSTIGSGGQTATCAVTNAYGRLA